MSGNRPTVAESNWFSAYFEGWSDIMMFNLWFERTAEGDLETGNYGQKEPAELPAIPGRHPGCPAELLAIPGSYPGHLADHL